MAVRVSKDRGIIAMDMQNKKVVAKLFADDKEDVTTDIIEGALEGKPDGYALDMESFVITADGEIGQLKSDGTWKWVGEDEAVTTTRNAPSLLKSSFIEDENKPVEDEFDEIPTDEGQTDEKSVESEPTDETLEEKR